MIHLTSIKDIEKVIADHRLCLFYIKAPDCGWMERESIELLSSLIWRNYNTTLIDTMN